jgi:hypothetical protein
LNEDEDDDDNNGKLVEVSMHLLIKLPIHLHKTAVLLHKTIVSSFINSTNSLRVLKYLGPMVVIC